METSTSDALGGASDSKMEVGDMFPYAIRDVPISTNTKLKGKFREKQDFVRVGGKDNITGYLLWSSYREHATKIYNMEVRPDDVWLVSYPRSGSTVTQEMVWLLSNNIDIETASAVPLAERFPFIERTTIIAGNALESCEIYKTLAEMKSQRFIMTHLPLSLAPAGIIGTARLIYVARDPRDVAVSLFHFFNLMKYVSPAINFKSFWYLFDANVVPWSPFFDHVKEAWEKRNHPNVLFLFYEDIAKDLPGTSRRVAKFLGKEYSDEQFQKLCVHLNFENFKNNKAVNKDVEYPSNSEGSGFIRKGQVGGWKEYFDEEIRVKAEKWIADNLKNTDLRFPSN